MILAIYVDDGLLAAEKEGDSKRLTNFLQKHFEITVMNGELFLGLELTRRPDGAIHLGQQKYIELLLKRFKMDNCKAASTPAENFNKGQGSMTEGKEMVNFPYREAVGSLIYLATATRPDISFAVGVVSRYLDAPTQAHVCAVKRIFRYLKGTTRMGIVYKKQHVLKLVCYSDADYASDTQTRRSTTGYVFLLGSGPVSWSSQRQRCVSLSTTESEYVAASQAVKEMIWLHKLLLE